ncbi:MAG TPA: hypothetical protein PLQ57_07290 [Saprospiraceae bacterium]|nr:hypothetical protein [Saprospiraceae bacterium]HRG66344.1 hypothetical protein [Saprospiraceae bacterium]
MNLTELTELWQNQQVQLQQTMEMNKVLTKEVHTLKLQQLFSSMRPIKIFTLVVGLLWVVFVDSILVTTYGIASPYFFWSALLQSAITKVAIGVYLYQLILLYQTDVIHAVSAVQQRIAHLTLSTLWVTRILFLQLPLWTTFWWTESFINGISPLAKSLIFAIAILFTAAALWLFLNIRIENSSNPWFRWIFGGREWDPLVKAQEVLEEL